MRRKLSKRLAAYFSATTMAVTAFFSVPAVSVHAEDEIAIDEAHFPDANFRDYVKTEFDTDGNGSLSEGEMNSVSEIKVSEKQISSLQGIEYFTQLKRLYCDKNNLSSLDVSNNTALRSLYCYENNLSSLDVSNNIALEWLDCDNNNLSSLDVSKNTALRSLSCGDNNLSSLDVSKNTALEYLACYQNNLSSLDVSKNTALEDLDCFSNNLSSLDVSKNTALEYLGCFENNLSSLDVSKNTALRSLSCDDTVLKTLSYNENSELAIASSIRYDDNNQYDLSQYNWLKTIDNYRFYDYDRIENIDSKSNITGTVINILDPDDELVDITCNGNKIMLKLYILGKEPFATYAGCEFIKDDNGDVRCYDSNGKQVINDFKCDGTYTYYFQADGTAMKDRLTYHPDGVHVIYFDSEGHEVFSDFANVKKTIAGEAVNDYCFFDVYGYLYVDVMTYDKSGTYLYYANPYGVLEMNKWFQFSENVKWADGTPCDGIAGQYGFATENGTLMTNQWTYDWEGRPCYIQGNGVALYQ